MNSSPYLFRLVIRLAGYRYRARVRFAPSKGFAKRLQVWPEGSAFMLRAAGLLLIVLRDKMPG